MKRAARSLALTLFIALAAWTIGLIRFAATLPDTVGDTTTRTDAIVVLTGGSDRLKTGFSLLARDLAGRIFVSGVPEQVSVDRLLERIGMPDYPKALRSRIFLGRRATNTVQNARETAEWCQNEGIRSIRLVTASYHLSRSLLEFHHAMPDVPIIAHPVFPEAVKQGRWWLYPGTLFLMTREYSKFLIASLGHMFGFSTGNLMS